MFFKNLADDPNFIDLFGEVPEFAKLFAKEIPDIRPLSWDGVEKSINTGNLAAGMGLFLELRDYSELFSIRLEWVRWDVCKERGYVRSGVRLTVLLQNVRGWPFLCPGIANLEGTTELPVLLIWTASLEGCLISQRISRVQMIVRLARGGEYSKTTALSITLLHLFNS